MLDGALGSIESLRSAAGSTPMNTSGKPATLGASNTPGSGANTGSFIKSKSLERAGTYSQEQDVERERLPSSQKLNRLSSGDQGGRDTSGDEHGELSKGSSTSLRTSVPYRTLSKAASASSALHNVVRRPSESPTNDYDGNGTPSIAKSRPSVKAKPSNPMSLLQKQREAMRKSKARNPSSSSSTSIGFPGSSTIGPSVSQMGSKIEPPSGSVIGGFPDSSASNLLGSKVEAPLVGRETFQTINEDSEIHFSSDAYLSRADTLLGRESTRPFCAMGNSSTNVSFNVNGLDSTAAFSSNSSASGSKVGHAQVTSVSGNRESFQSATSGPSLHLPAGLAGVGGGVSRENSSRSGTMKYGIAQQFGGRESQSESKDFFKDKVKRTTSRDVGSAVFDVTSFEQAMRFNAMKKTGSSQIARSGSTVGEGGSNDNLSFTESKGSADGASADA